MAKEVTLGLSKRFGARYGRPLREKHAEMETAARKKYVCPHCSREKVKRIAVGIWNCRHCNNTFTGKAYTPILKAVIPMTTEAAQ